MFFIPSDLCKAGFTLECERNANTNAACKNEAIGQCICVTEASQTALGCATNFGEQPNAISQLPVLQREFAYNTFT